MIHTFDLCGAGVFAVAGALAAGKKQMDLFGVVVLAMATALGGGSVRDVMLGIYPVFWVADPAYVIVVAACALVTFVAAHWLRPPTKLLMMADAVGLAFYTVLGMQKAQSLGVSMVISVLMGITTGVVGGILRDVLSGEIPLVLRREIYATAALAGAVVFAVLSALAPRAAINVVAAMAVVLALRLAAIRWTLSLPVFPAAGKESTPK
jgi:uncharacterized membrane protein YeiH